MTWKHFVRNNAEQLAPSEPNKHLRPAIRCRENSHQRWWHQRHSAVHTEWKTHTRKNKWSRIINTWMRAAMLTILLKSWLGYIHGYLMTQKKIWMQQCWTAGCERAKQTLTGCNPFPRTQPPTMTSASQSGAQAMETAHTHTWKK